MVITAEKVGGQKMTIAQFLSRDDFEEGYIYELINGEIMKRTSPNHPHQKLVSRIGFYVNAFILPKNLGELYPAPIDVYLSSTADLVVPDLNFVSTANANILQPSGYILGSPDIVVEILSKGTQQVDRGIKMRLYRRYNVPEYWIVDPVRMSVEVYVLEENEYILKSFAEEIGEIESSVLVGFKLEVAKLFF